MDDTRKKALMGTANRKLTNYLTGNNMPTVQNTIKDRFNFQVQNGNTSSAVAVALLTGNIDTENIVFTAGTSGAADTFTHNMQNLTPLTNAGYTADVVLEDAAITVSGSTITMAAGSGMSIAHFRRYIQHNPRMVKRITIMATDSDGKANPDAFDCAMKIGTVSPFQHETCRAVDLNQFFSVNQFQSGKIVIDYPNNLNEGLEMSDLLYWGVEVAAGTTMKFNVEFYED